MTGSEHGGGDRDHPVWPSSRELLTSTHHCPSCFTPLTSAVCSSCRLDLNHPAALELAEAGERIAEEFDARTALITRIRHETREALARERLVAPQTPDVVDTAPAPPASPQAPSTGELPGASASATATPASLEGAPAAVAAAPAPATQASTAPRRSSVQLALLITGISLLSVFAIFFIVYAFINYGLIWRSIIIAGATIAAIVTSSLLRRKSLRASAEGIAVLAVILVYLDIFAARANGLFGLSEVTALDYWGAALLTSGVALILWYRATGLRSASIVGYSVFAPGAALLAGGATSELSDWGTAAAVTSLSMLAAGLAGHTAVLRRTPETAAIGAPRAPALTERTIVLITAVFAALFAFASGLAVQPESVLGASGALLVLAFLLLTHLVITLLQSPLPRGAALSAFQGASFAFGLGVVSTFIPGTIAFRAADPTDTVLLLVVPTLAAAVISTIWLVLVHRTTPLIARSLRWGLIGSLLLGLAGTLVALSIAAITGITSVFVEWLPGWRDNEVLHFGNDDRLAVMATLLGVLLITCLALAFIGRLARSAPAIAQAAALLIVLAVTLTPQAWTAALLWSLLGAVALQSLFSTRLHRIRVALGVVAIGGIGLGWLAGWQFEQIWPVTSGITILALLHARRLFTPITTRAVLLLMAIAAGLLHLTVAANTTVGAEDGLVTAATLLYAGLLATASALDQIGGRIPTASGADRRLAFWSAVTIAAVASLTLPTVQLSAQSPTTAGLMIGGLALMTIAVALWMLRARAGAPQGERVAAAALIAPSLATTLGVGAEIAGLPDGVTGYAALTASVLVAATALALDARGYLATSGVGANSPRPGDAPSHPQSSSTPLRAALDVSAAVVAATGIVLSVLNDTQPGWLTLLIASITVMLIASSRDGLIGSDSPRRHLGWLSLAIATSGLWWWLDGTGVTDPEPYVLPLGAALAVIATLTPRLRGGTRASESPSAASAAAIWAGALLVLIVPTASATGHAELWQNETGPDFTLIRALCVGTASAAILLISALSELPSRLPGIRVPALVVGTIGLVVTVANRGYATIFPQTPSDGALTGNIGVNALLELWLLPAVVVLGIAAWGMARRARPREPRRRAAELLGAQLIVGIALLLATLLETTAAFEAPVPSIRITALVLTLSAFHVAAALIARPPLTTAASWFGLGLAAAVGIIGLSSGLIDTVELVAAPIAVALLASGGIHLARTPSAGSWPWLAPGTLLLTLPTLLATIDDRVIWRLVGLGVVGVAIIITALFLRLQAPFVIGVTVTLIHAVASLTPQIRALYELADWYVWAGIGGAILVALAIRYEQRLKNVKDMIAKISALR